MIVVADTTPLRYLVAIEREHLLPALYGRVLAGGASEVARNPAADPHPGIGNGSGQRRARSNRAGRGGAADLLLVDEWDARLEAGRRHLRVVGTLRMLADGASHGLADLEESFRRLRHTNFRVNAELLESLLEEYRRGMNK